MTTGIQITTRTTPRKRKRPSIRGILWEGPSPLDGAPIAVIATDDTENEKIGDMIQLWILRTDMHPVEARQTGADAAICGTCPYAGGRGCYVNANPLGAIYRAYRRGSYGRVTVADFAKRKVRFGAYGDPVCIPQDLVSQITKVSSGWTGYTHQWRDPAHAWARDYFMASTETPTGRLAALAAGWRLFHVVAPGETPPAGMVECLSDARGVTCHDCGLCDGTRGGKRETVRSIWITGHGSAPVVKRLLATLSGLTD